MMALLNKAARRGRSNVSSRSVRVSYITSSTVIRFVEFCRDCLENSEWGKYFTNSYLDKTIGQMNHESGRGGLTLMGQLLCLTIGDCAQGSK